MEAYVSVSQLGTSYESDEGVISVLEDFSLRVGEGEFFTLIGNKGCGKSTVLKLIAGLIPRTTGMIQIGNRKVSCPGPDRAIVLPTPCLMPWMTALDNVLLGLEQVHQHGEPGHRRSIAVNCLEIVGMADFMEVRTSQLPSEMLQRIAIARAIALKPRVLLLDDPFCAFASTARHSLQKVLRHVLAQCEMTTLMATCDIDEALLLSDHIALMTQGPRTRVSRILERPHSWAWDEQVDCKQPEYVELHGLIREFLDQQEHASGQIAGNSVDAKRSA